MSRSLYFVASAGLCFLSCLPLAAADTASPSPTLGKPVSFAVSPPLREIAKLPAQPVWALHETESQSRVPKPMRKLGPVVDLVEQNSAAPSANVGVQSSFLGLGLGFPNFVISGAPPDTNMAVGDTQIVQWVNVQLAVFDKSGNVLAGPIDGSNLWSSLGGECANNNDSDPIAQFDKAHHRWLLAQNVFHLHSGSQPPYFACVAVSTSSDALGSYYMYQFPLGDHFPDYPKWAVWSNGYYQSQNDFTAGGAQYIAPKFCAYNDAKLRVGDASAEQVCFELAGGDGGAQPADIDSTVPPPANQDEFFFAIWDANHLSEYSFHADYAHPANSFVTGTNGAQLLEVPAFNPACNGNFGGACVPELNGENLDVLGSDIMYRIAYWDDTPAPSVGPTAPPSAAQQHWYINHDATGAAGNQAPRWYELVAPQRSTPVTGLTLFQAGTYAPDSNHRWMASIARDKARDILLGYSKSSATTHPAIDIAGRIPTDPLGTLETEVTVLNGTGSQQSTQNRWGDYSAMRIDLDGCTFWYTTEYYMVTASFSWSTQVASAKFPSCH
jgi:hypothetical protein